MNPKTVKLKPEDIRQIIANHFNTMPGNVLFMRDECSSFYAIVTYNDLIKENNYDH